MPATTFFSFSAAMSPIDGLAEWLFKGAEGVLLFAFFIRNSKEHIWLVPSKSINPAPSTMADPRLLEKSQLAICAVASKVITYLHLFRPDLLERF